MKKLVLTICLLASVILCAQTNQLGPVTQAVAFSATPTFNASVANAFLMTLTNNVTSSTLTGGYAGQIITLVITQDGTGSRTFAWPTNVTGAPNIKAAANAITAVSLLNGVGGWTLSAPYASGVQTAYTNATTTFSNVPDLGWSVAASGQLHAVCRITWQGSATTTGPKYQVTGPASPTAVAVGVFSNVTSSTYTSGSAVAFSSAVANAGTITATTNFTDTVDVQVQNGTTAGTVQLQEAANGAGTLTVQPGSSCIVQAQ